MKGMISLRFIVFCNVIYFLRWPYIVMKNISLLQVMCLLVILQKMQVMQALNQLNTYLV